MLKMIFFINFWKKLFINFFKKKKIYNFPGGIQFPQIKNIQNEYFLNYLPLSKKFCIYLKNISKTNILKVQINQKILRGQPLSTGDADIVPIHSPTSGWVKDIYFESDSALSKKKKIIIVIIPDYLDTWIRLKKITNYKKYTSNNLIKKIHQSGIVGLGGGQFPSSKKLLFSVNKVHTLIINAVESEPYISSDMCVIKNYFNEIIIGSKIICWIVKIKSVLIAIQEDKIDLIKCIQEKIKNQSLFKICILKKKYPGGSSKILIKSLTGQEIPYGKHAVDIGYLVFNISTIYSIKRAIINGEPLIERIITFYYKNNYNIYKNCLVRIGTSVKFCLNYLNITNLHNKKIYSGSIFMNNIIVNLNTSILKNISCIYIKKKSINKKKIKYSCINCSYCSQLCPMHLLPQQLYLYIKNKKHEMAKQFYIMDCIECKICEKVCPSNISLVQYFKNEKKIQKNIDLENKRKKYFSLCFKNREKRLLHQKKEKELHTMYELHEKNQLNIVAKSKNILKINAENKKHEEKKIRRKILYEAIKRAKSKK